MVTAPSGVDWTGVKPARTMPGKSPAMARHELWLAGLPGRAPPRLPGSRGEQAKDEMRCEIAVASFLRPGRLQRHGRQAGPREPPIFQLVRSRFREAARCFAGFWTFARDFSISPPFPKSGLTDKGVPWPAIHSSRTSCIARAARTRSGRRCFPSSRARSPSPPRSACPIPR